MDPGDRLAAGLHALEAAKWDAARAEFEAALELEETAEARDGLGQALWFGPTLKARERLTAEGTWEECRREIVAMAERRNDATDGSLVLDAEYLVAVGRKAG